MKITTERRQLADALKRVTPAAAKTASNPVLLGVRIEASAGQANLSCTDLDLTIEHWVDATNITPGNVVVPAQLLARLVGTLAGDTVTIDTTDIGQVTVTSGDTTAELNTIDGDMWPQFQPIDGTPNKLDADTVNDLRRITHAASTDATRPLLCCVGFNRGHAVCTDSYRLAAMPLDVGDPDANVPATTLAAALNATPDNEGATLTFGAHEIAWETGATTIRGRLNKSGDYPNWPALLRKDSPSSITVDATALANALKRVGVINDGTMLATTITPNDDDTVTVERHATGTGNVTDRIQLFEHTGPLVAFACNVTFMADALRNLHPDDATVTLELADSLKPVMWTSGNVVSLLMPVRVT